MLKINRQCATIQVSVINDGDVMIFDESASPEAPGNLEGILRRAMVHEIRTMEGIISNQFHDRIATLQRRVKELEEQLKGRPMKDVTNAQIEYMEPINRLPSR